MKYALITEEQIKAIEWVIKEMAYPSSLEPINPTTIYHTLAIVNSLKVKEPSMVSSTSNKSFAMYTIEIPFVGEQP